VNQRPQPQPPDPNLEVREESPEDAKHYPVQVRSTFVRLPRRPAPALG
jgi:hypothetical protein